MFVCVCVSALAYRLYENKGESDFMESVRNLFTSFSIMMNSDAESTSMVKVRERARERTDEHACDHVLSHTCLITVDLT